MPNRTKGETCDPVKTLQLVATLGVTKAAKELGVSTTTLHKARRGLTVSKVVEMAATGLLVKHAPKRPANAQPAAVAEMASFAPTPEAEQRHRDALFVIAVDAEKAPLVRRFAELLDAEFVAA